MSEPAAYLATNPTHPSNADALVWKPKDWHITWEFKPLYLHPDPRIAELEAVLRECRRVFDYYDCNMEQWSVAEERKLRREAISKIDEVLK